MKGFTSRRIDEAGAIFDGPHATPGRRDTGRRYFLNIASLDNGRLDLGQSDFVDDDDFKKWTRRVQPQEGDLLFSYETRLGEAALMPAGVEACLGRRMGLIRPDHEVVHPRFLLYYWLSPEFKELIRENSVHGATVSRIPLNRLGSWIVNLPDLPTQCAISDVLGALDDKIAANRNLIELGTQWMLARWQQITLGSAVTVRWSDVVKTNPPTPTRRGIDVSYLDMKNLPQHGLLVERWEPREAKGGARFVNGDTLLARITPCFENGKLGFVDFLDDDEVGYGSTEFIVYRPCKSIPVAVAYCVVSDESFREEAARSMTGTSGRQRVQASSLTDYELKWPSASELAEFGSATDALLQRMGAARDENQVLARTRDELLPLLMNGKVTVKQAAAKVEKVL